MAGVTSSYPAALDSESNLTPPNNGDTLSVADHWLAGNSGPIVAIETELGTDPAGYATDVKTRLDDINPSEGNLNLDAGYGSKAPIYGVRAWVNFNGTGTVAIRDSGNVSSITDNGTGDYTVNFTSAMPDINYSVLANTTGFNTNCQQNNTFDQTASAFKLQLRDVSGGFFSDTKFVTVGVVR